jgi:hypothetical protein
MTLDGGWGPRAKNGVTFPLFLRTLCGINLSGKSGGDNNNVFRWFYGPEKEKVSKKGLRFHLSKSRDTFF